MSIRKREGSGGVEFVPPIEGKGLSPLRERRGKLPNRNPKDQKFPDPLGIERGEA